MTVCPFCFNKINATVGECTVCQNGHKCRKEDNIPERFIPEGMGAIVWGVLSVVVWGIIVAIVLIATKVF